jgi:hypothetical protein
MPRAQHAAYLRDRSANFRRLAKDYDEAGQHPVWIKLIEVAVDLETQAAALETIGRGRPA